MPLLIPGVLAASVLVLVRTVGMFELTYLVAGQDSQTLVVALFDSMSAAGIRPQQQTDAMAVPQLAATNPAVPGAVPLTADIDTP